MVDASAIITILLASAWKGALFPPQAKLKNNTHVDFIIAGGGTAGCALARRLAEDPNCTVLVLEAGGDPNSIAMAPGLFFLAPGSDLDFGYNSTPDLYAGGQGNRTKLTSGRVLGGSSALNHLLYIRPPGKDLDDWAATIEDDSYNYTNFLSYFKKSEGLKDQEIADKSSNCHGTEGPIGVSRLLSNDETVTGFLNAQVEVGKQVVDDLNCDKNIGFAHPQYTIASDSEDTVGGVRQTTSYSYLYPIKNNSNLYVYKGMTVSKVIVEDKTAVGVEAVYKGETYTFKANKEVILSAGAFNSPQLLFLSGIGPKEHLESLGIKVQADLAVGDNLRVPSAVGIVTKTKKHLLPINIIDLLPALNPTKLAFPVIQGSGAVNKSSNIPSYQTYNLMLKHDTPFLLIVCAMVYGYSLDICIEWQKQSALRDTVWSTLVHLDAISTGTVRLNTTDPFDDPIITTGFYNNTEDLEKMVTYIMDFIPFVDAPSYKEMGAKVIGVDFSACAHVEYGTRDFWKCYILNRTFGDFLYYGSCAMGRVVDNDFKVIGFNNLRVVDASVIPVRIHGAINSVVIALAEKAADKIKETCDCTA